MKKQTAAMLGVCGLAAAASAQNFSLTLVPSVQTIDTSAGAVTITMSVIGDADVGTHMLDGAFSMHSNSQLVQDMREDKDLTNVTLVCEDGEQVEADKIILAASSPFFMDILARRRHPHPLI